MGILQATHYSLSIALQEADAQNYGMWTIHLYLSLQHAYLVN